MKRNTFILVNVIIIMLFLPVLTLSGSISLDYTTGTWDDGGTVKLIPGCPQTFYFRYINDNGVNANGITNGFRIYGPSSFDPPVVTILDPDFSTTGFFDLVFHVSYFSANGLGADTVGLGGSKLLGTGLPTGYNDVAFSITTGSIDPSETLCIDSSYFPPAGMWLWSPGGAPSWGGPYCFQSEIIPCLPVSFTNMIDTLTAFTCDTITYDFEVIDDKCKKNTKNALPHVFYLLDGPGTIDSVTGEWFFIAGVDDINTIQDLHIAVYDLPLCLGGSEAIVTLNLLDSVKPGDLNQTCTVDVGDLVFLVDFMFNDGPAPIVLDDADINGDSIIDIADLVHLVEYMFGNGPPPVG